MGRRLLDRVISRTHRLCRSDSGSGHSSSAGPIYVTSSVKAFGGYSRRRRVVYQPAR